MSVFIHILPRWYRKEILGCKCMYKRGKKENWAKSGTLGTQRYKSSIASHSSKFDPGLKLFKIIATKKIICSFKIIEY